uniref:Uncharacterized protein n=1 Tax=Opuntia streptacantha TaxID=393608 RepID=A0A7C9DCK9_OPUST
MSFEVFTILNIYTLHNGKLEMSVQLSRINFFLLFPSNSCVRVSSIVPALSGAMHELTLYVSPFLELCGGSQSPVFGLFPHQNWEILVFVQPQGCEFESPKGHWRVFLVVNFRAPRD